MEPTWGEWNDVRVLSGALCSEDGTAMTPDMRPNELEHLVLRLIDDVASEKPVEDSRVELKGSWPTDTTRAARRLAGHCNAARGEPVIWVIGVDESQGLRGALREDLPAWIDQVKKCFVGLSPDLVRDIDVQVADKTVVALLFATDRAPFVVKNPEYGQPSGGPVESEVPWREGTGVRSCRRDDLLRLLIPIQQLPSVTVIEGFFSSILAPSEKLPRNQTEEYCQLQIQLYVVPKSRETVVLAFHECQARVSIEPHPAQVNLRKVVLGPKRKKYRGFDAPVFPVDNRLSRTVDGTANEVLISGPGLVVFTAEGVVTPCSGWETRRGSYSVSLGVAGTAKSIVIRGDLVPADEDERPIWICSPSTRVSSDDDRID